MSSLLRVLFLNQAFYPDVVATAQHAHDLARHLVARGHEVAVIASRSIYGQKGASLPRYEVKDGIEIYRVGSSLFGKSTILLRIIDFAFFYVMAGWKALRVRRPDVVVPFTTPPFIALVGVVLQIFRHCKFVYWVMDLYPDVLVACGVMRPRSLTERFLEAVNRFCLRHADRVVVLGRCMQQRVLDKGIDPAKVIHVGVWSDSDEVKPIPRLENPYRRDWGLADAFVVMYAGNFGLGHDVQTMCEAVLRLRDRSNIRFAFVGGGKRKQEVEAFLRQHQLRNAVCHDYQPRAQLDALLSLGDLHLVSLAQPVTGLVVPCKLFGIMAAERPTAFIGHPDSEIARVLIEHNCGVVIPCGNTDALVQVIEELAADPQRQAELGQRARQALHQAYDRRRACESWERILLEVTTPPTMKDPHD